MLKSILLTIIMLVSLTAFSQTGTKTTTDSVVQLPKNVAKEVVKDIIKLDSCNAELSVVKTNYAILENNLILKDSVINAKQNIILLHEEKEKNLNLIIGYVNDQKENLKVSVDALKKDLKKAKRDNVKIKIGAGAIIAFLAYVIVK